MACYDLDIRAANPLTLKGWCDDAELEFREGLLDHNIARPDLALRADARRIFPGRQANWQACPDNEFSVSLTQYQWPRGAQADHRRFAKVAVRAIQTGDLLYNLDARTRSGDDAIAIKILCPNTPPP